MKTKLITFVAALVFGAAFGQQKPSYTDAEAGKHVGEDAMITGRLANVSISGTGTTFLNLGDRFPRQTFGGVIFASKQAAVGDVKQYEGKDVTLSGRIELSRDQKPQIIISSPDQIKLAGAADPSAPPAPAPVAATPMPAAPPATAPTVPPSSEPIVEKRTGKVELPMGWNTPRRGGESARKDLARLFGYVGSASEEARVDTSIEIYPGIPFLTPVDTAKKTLNLNGSTSSKVKVSTSGFPADAFSAHVFSGVFPGGFNRLFLVTDSQDQVVSILLVDSSSRTRVVNEPDTTGYHTFNFVSGGAKATGNLAIRHQVSPGSTATGVVVVDTLLVDPTDPEDQVPVRKTKGSSSKTTTYNRQKTGRVLERSRWFVPVPIVNLIMRCCVGG